MNQPSCAECGQPAGVIGLCRKCYLQRRQAPKEGELTEGYVGAGRFQLRNTLGEGGHGTVWLARDNQNSQDGHEELVALKFLGARTADDPRALARLRNEMILARRLNHPNVVRVYDLHEHPGEDIFYSMAYVQGSDLRTYLEASATGRLTGAMIEPWVKQIAEGLGHCHNDVRVFHRDLKPANIILEPSGAIRLVDFGIAFSDNAGDTGLAQKGLTPAYASPQQIRGEPACAMDDMYSLGATLYHLVTGCVPAPEGTETIHPRRRIMENGGSPKDLTPEASETIMRCLSEDPMRRPASMAEFWTWYSLTGPVDEEAPGPDPWERVWAILWDGLRYATVAALLIGAGWYLANRLPRPGGNSQGTNVSGSEASMPEKTDGPSTSKVDVARGVLEVRIKLPVKASGLVRLAAGRVEDVPGGQPLTLDIQTGTNLATGQFTLEPGRYWIAAGRSGVMGSPGWVRGQVTIGTNKETLELSLVPVPVDMRLTLEADVRLYDTWSNWVALRPSDLHRESEIYQLVDSAGKPRLMPGLYRIELGQEFRDDWILDDPMIEVRTTESGVRMIRPRKRPYPRMNAEWTASGAALGLLTSEWKFVPVPGFTNLLGSTTEVAIGQFEPFASEIGLADIALPRRFGDSPTRPWRRPFPDSTDSHPVVGITWHEATNFAGWLTLKCRQGGQLTERQRFRLPTCAEWTAMAGPDRYPWGNEFPPSDKVSNLAGQELANQANWPASLRDSSLLPSTKSGDPWPMRVDQLDAVRGQFRAMGGNVAEWCEDDYHSGMNPPKPWKDMLKRLQDPALQAGCKVVRGGSWINGHEPELLLTSTHWPERPDTRSDTIGFRLVVVEE